MVQRIDGQLNRFTAFIFSVLLPLVLTGSSQGQILRAPDLGVWLVRQRSASGENSVVVADLLSDGVFAKAGLREGDRIVSIDGRPIEREAQFVQAFLNNHTVGLVVWRNGENQTLSLNSPTVMQGTVAADPFYQSGFLTDEHNLDRMTVQRVFSCTPAFYAGLRSGDVVVSINNQTILSADELAKMLRLGRDLTLVVHRNGQPRQLTLPTTGQVSRLRGTTTASNPGPLPPYTPPAYGIPPAPLLAPPAIPSQMPAIPSPPPVIPSLPPPGAVPRG